MYIILLVSVLLLSSTSLAQFVITAHNPLTEELNNATARGIFGFDVAAFLKKKGYPFENHEVTTEDGYVLAIHRIPYGRNSSETKADDPARPAVLIMHGTGSSSVDYFILGPDRSLALMLADQGYDVWLGNNRGNTWSRKHLTLDPDNDTTFWEFSFHELGVYDVSCMIDYVLSTTKNEKISYIGHSQGTTQFFVLASQLPKYNDKINIMAALAPAVYCQNLTNPIVQILKNYYTVVELLTDYLNVTEVLGHSFVIETALKLVCKDKSKYQEACALVFFLLFGFDSGQFDRSELVTMLDVFPAGFSIKGIKHYLQLVKSGHFRQFDYGIINNLNKYNKAAPPDYNLGLVTTPVALYYGKNDWLVGMTNVDQLADELPNLLEKHLIEYDYFNHMDFLIARDAVSMLYYDVVNKLNEINSLPPLPSTSSTSTSTTITTTSGKTTTTVGPNVTSSGDGVDPTTPSKATKTTDPQDATTPGAGFSVNSFIQVTCIFMLTMRFVI